jgi:hypothetical protein
LPQGEQSYSRPPARNSRKSGDWLKRALEESAEEVPGPLPGQEVGLVRSLLVAVARRDHHPFHAQIHHLVEETARALRVRALEEGGVGGDAEAPSERCADGATGLLPRPLAAHREVVLRLEAVEVHAEAQVAARSEEIELLL